MRPTRCAVSLFVILSLTACGDDKKPAVKPPGAGEQAAPAAPSSGLALPVTAPMAARRRLLHDLDKNKAAARKRANQFDSAVEQNR